MKMRKQNFETFSRDEVLGILASLVGCFNPDDLVWQIAQYMKQMGIDTEQDPSYVDDILWDLHEEGIRYPDGSPIFDPEEKGLTLEEMRDFAEQWLREKEMQSLKES
jgi:hypothetical protein